MTTSDLDDHAALARHFKLLQIKATAAAGQLETSDPAIAALCREVDVALRAGRREIAAAKIQELDYVLEKSRPSAQESDTAVVDGRLISALLKQRESGRR